MAIRGMSSEVAIVRHVSAGDTVLAGALAGAIGGVVVALTAMITAVSGMDTLSPIRLIGATFLGPGALEGGASIIGFGLLLHLVVSAGWGIVFAAILPRVTSMAAALVGGLAFGLVVMLVMLYLVLPVANPLMREAVDGTSAFMLAHLLYGATFALVPLIRARLSMH